MRRDNGDRSSETIALGDNTLTPGCSTWWNIHRDLRESLGDSQIVSSARLHPLCTSSQQPQNTQHDKSLVNLQSQLPSQVSSQSSYNISDYHVSHWKLLTWYRLCHSSKSRPFCKVFELNLCSVFAENLLRTLWKAWNGKSCKERGKMSGAANWPPPGPGLVLRAIRRHCHRTQLTRHSYARYLICSIVSELRRASKLLWWVCTHYVIVPKIASLAPICVMGQLALGCSVTLCMNNMTTLVLRPGQWDRLWCWW